MNKPKLALGVELTGNEARLALVERGDQGLVLLSTQTVPLTDDLGRVFRAFPRRPTSVACAISLEQAAVRILDIPPTTDENLERVIAMESEAVLPLEVEELALAHHAMGMTEQSRMEVLVAAARQTTVQAALRQVNCVPWVAASVTLSAVAVLNAAREMNAVSRDGVTALLKIERGASELLVLQGSRILTSLYLPIGCGAEVSAPTPARVPVTAGGGGHSEPEGLAGTLPWIVTLSQQARYVLQALCYERGLTIERLYVCGEGAARAAVMSQLSERLPHPTALLAPPGTTLPEGAAYTVAFGCAAQAAGGEGIQLNLTPARVSAAREVEQRRQTRVSWGTLAASVALASGMIFAAVLHQKEEALAKVDAKLAEVDRLVPADSGAATAGLKTAVTAIEGVQGERVAPGRLLSVLSRQMPAGTWLADLSYNALTGSVVRGFSVDEGGAQRALTGMLRQQLFDEVTLDYRTEDHIGSVPVWSFQLTCKLKDQNTRSRRTGGTR